MASISSLSRRKAKSNTPAFDLRTQMHRILGKDLTLINGISELTAHTFFTEVGPDLSKFKNENHFSSWLNLSPNNKISGGKILSSKTGQRSNRLAHALRLSANSLWNSYSYIGNYFCRMRARRGAPKAITATPHKLAGIIFYLVKNQKSFDESVFAEQEKAHDERMKKRLKRQAESIGFQPVTATV